MLLFLAKAYILKVKYHTGYWSCTKCCIKGSWLGEICFPGKCGKARNDEAFAKFLYKDDNLNQRFYNSTGNWSNLHHPLSK